MQNHGIGALVESCGNSSPLAMEIPQFCTKPSVTHVNNGSDKNARQCHKTHFSMAMEGTFLIFIHTWLIDFNQSL